jgi:hypothetical protein
VQRGIPNVVPDVPLQATPLLLLLLPQADKDSAVESTVAALESRSARLAAELEDAALALEVCRAKAGMYDDLHAKAERLVSEQ